MDGYYEVYGEEDMDGIECPKCGFAMVQDENDLWRFYCPICKNEGRLVEIK